MAISNAVSLANFTSGDALTIDSVNDRVGIASTVPTTTLDVDGSITSGNINSSGIVTATSFVGAVTGNVTGNTSGTAGGLTGTPDITVGTVTGTTGTFTGNVSGVDGTFTGNVSVGGTVTYEDVANVDSVGVITARAGLVVSGGTVTIPTVAGTNTNASLNVLFQTGSGVIDGGSSLTFNPGSDTFSVNGSTLSSNTFRGAGSSATLNCNNGAGNYDVRTSNTNVLLVSGGTTRVDASATALKLGPGLFEPFENAGTTLGSQPNNPLSDGNVILFTGNESGNKTINFTGIHAVLSSGETVSFTAILTPNNSGVINVVQVDGQAITVKWSGGSAPSAGSSGQDIYTFQILKTGAGTSDYTVFGAAANYA